MVADSWIPDRGDVVWLQFSPQSGHEQAGRRPALVLSPAAYNSRVGLMLCCPITSRAKGYPFEVPLPAGLKASGVVLCDQVRSLDWRMRHAELIDTAAPIVCQEVIQRIKPLLGIAES